MPRQDIPGDQARIHCINPQEGKSPVRSERPKRIASYYTLISAHYQPREPSPVTMQKDDHTPCYQEVCNRLEWIVVTLNEKIGKHQNSDILVMHTILG